MTPDGLYVYATGYVSSGVGGYDYATVAYLVSSGAIIGVRRYNGSGNGSDYGNAIAVSATIAYVTGQSAGGGSSDDFLTAAYKI